jgi:hypothetical protein
MVAAFDLKEFDKNVAVKAFLYSLEIRGGGMFYTLELPKINNSKK